MDFGFGPGEWGGGFIVGLDEGIDVFALDAVDWVVSYWDTETDGRYVLPGLRTETGYRITFWDDMDIYTPEYYDDRADFASADLVTVHVAPVLGIDAALDSLHRPQITAGSHSVAEDAASGCCDALLTP